MVSLSVRGKEPGHLKGKRLDDNNNAQGNTEASVHVYCMCVCVFVCRSTDYLWKISERSFLCDQVETLYYPPISSLNNLLAYSTIVIDLRTPKTIYMQLLW